MTNNQSGRVKPEPKREDKKKDNYQDTERIPPKAVENALLNDRLKDNFQPYSNDLNLDVSELIDFSQGADSY